MFKYYVVVDHPDFKTEVHTELRAETGSNTVPLRPVECEDPMPGSLHNGIFWLTPEEADTLNQDSRIRDVHRIPEEIGLFPKHHGTRAGSFDKTTSINASMRNWALNRCINTYNNFGSASSTSSNYTYNLDGTGVDIIIMDTGVESKHPEFAVNADGSGGSRVVNHDWTQYGYITSPPTGGFLGDCAGHGTNVASIAAGNTCGWASGAAIYTMRMTTDGAYTDITTGAPLELLDELQCWQTIRAFHLAKTPTSTGYVRPTIVNCSFGYPTTYSNIASITYQGVTHTTSTTTAIYGTIGVPDGGDGTHGYRYSAEEADIQSCISVGVIVVASAGNDRHKIDVSTGLDYNNYWTSTGNASYYYHRGSSPGSTPNVICVGAISTTVPEHKINFSATGPRVDIFAPGSTIMGGYSSTTYIATLLDTRSSVSDPASGHSYYMDKISGTSQASPQVVGLVACLLQARPWMTATNVLNFIQSSALKGQLNESYYGQTGTYTNFASLQGAGNYFLYMPFNSNTSMSSSHTTSSWDVAFTSANLTASRTNAQLGGRTDYTGSANANSAVSVAWTISSSSVTASVTGIPFHSYYNSAAQNIPAVQNYSKTWTYCGGTNVAGTQGTLGGGKVGLWLNGISMFNPSAAGGAPGGYTTFTNWHYNAAFEAGTEYGYSFGEDNAGAHAAPPNEYHYHDGSMITSGAWVNGKGHTAGTYGATGLPECAVIPYLHGGLQHTDGHSKIMGICADGYPVYGPYGYSTATDSTSGTRRMVPGYALNPTFVSQGFRTTNGTTPSPLSTYPLGMFVEDWSFVGGGDLDTHNGRYCVTPEYPNGTYAYFLAFNSSMKPTYHYVIGNTYYGTRAVL